MKKNISEYLPYYLRTEVELVNDITDDYHDDDFEVPQKGSIGKLSMLNYGDFNIQCGSECESWRIGVSFEKSYIATWDMQDFKLRLRPLSDMTEEEKHEYYTIKGENSFDEFEGKSTAYLLSKHFDLFNLIPSGLALDGSIKKEKSL